MARQVRGTITVSIAFEEVETTPSTAEGSPSRVPHTINYSKEFTSGTTAPSQVNRVYSSNAGAAVTSGTTHDLVSVAGLPSRLDGATNVSFDTGVVVIAVEHTGVSPTHAFVDVGAGTNPFSGHVAASGDAVRVGPGGFFLWVSPDGAAPTAGTADILRLLHTGTGTAPTKLLLVGRS